MLDVIPDGCPPFLSDEQSFDGAIFVNRCLVGLPGTSRGCRETTSQWIPSQFQTCGGAANPSRFGSVWGAIRVSGGVRFSTSWLTWRKSVVELEGSVEAAPFQQAILVAELVLALALMLIEVSNAHLAWPCPRMLLFALEGLGCLAADLDRALDPQPGRTGTAGTADQCSGYEGVFDAAPFLATVLAERAFHTLRLLEDSPLPAGRCIPLP